MERMDQERVKGGGRERVRQRGRERGRGEQARKEGEKTWALGFRVLV